MSENRKLDTTKKAEWGAFLVGGLVGTLWGEIAWIIFGLSLSRCVGLGTAVIDRCAATVQNAE